MQRTKMVFTLGPATDRPGVLRKLIHTGMNCARFNLSHGTHGEHAGRLRRLRQEAKQQGKPVAALLDLCGPKLRVGRFQGGGIQLAAHAEVRLTPRDILGKTGLIPMSYPALAREVKPGEPILLDDGMLKLKVVRSEKSEVVCRVENGGMLKDHKGMNLPGMALAVAALTPKDKEDVRFGVRQGFDFFALSFVRTAVEIRALKQLLQSLGSRAGVIAKIEKPQAIPHLEEIIQAADGIMIARGDLGVEMQPEQVPVLQKQIITLANQHGRFVITATQMLQSMIESPLPTRAEATDVANAVFDGTDAIMLSGETASGNYPVQAAEMMARIALSAETTPEYNRLHLQPETRNSADWVVAAGVALAEKAQAKAMVVLTHSGQTARLVSRQRPRVGVVALSHSEEVGRSLQLVWGVQPLFLKQRPRLEGGLGSVDRFLLAQRCVKPGDRAVILASSPKGAPTNFIKLHTLGA